MHNGYSIKLYFARRAQLICNLTQPSTLISFFAVARFPGGLFSEQCSPAYAITVVFVLFRSNIVGDYP